MQVMKVGECEDEHKSIANIKQAANKSLSKLDKLLHENYSYNESKMIMTLAIEYAECLAKQYFVQGMKHGIILCKELNSLESSF